MTGPSQLEVRECDLPPVPPDGGLLRVEVCGVCGSDVDLFAGRNHAGTFPVVPGHEPVGVVERLGDEARAAWNLAEGDRIALLGLMRCGRCAGCAVGTRCLQGAPGETRAYGFRSADLDPPLWGGMATHLMLGPESQFVRMSPDLPVNVASLYNAVANGVEWAVATGGARLGSRVLVLGPGPRGLASLVAAKAAGAEHVTVVGLPADAERLALARDLGADVAEAVGGGEVADVLGVVGSDADLVVDTTPSSLPAVEIALAAARPGGTVVLAGLKGDGRAASLPVDDVIHRRLVVRSGFSKSPDSTRRAVELLSRPGLPYERWASHAFPLDEVGAAVAAAAGEHLIDGRRATHVRIEPWL